MTTLSGSTPAHVQGALIVTPAGGTRQIIRFQLNPETLTRQLQPQVRGGNVDEHSDELHYVGAPVEQIQVEAMFDATSALDRGDPVAQRYGLLPQLAQLETLLLAPSSTVATQAQRDLDGGVMTIDPFRVPLVVFVWGRRSVPVQVTAYSVTEEQFDTNLNPIRAFVRLTMRVLTYSDVSTNNAASSLYMAHQVHQERLAKIAVTGGGGSS